MQLVHLFECQIIPFPSGWFSCYWQTRVKQIYVQLQLLLICQACTWHSLVPRLSPTLAAGEPGNEATRGKRIQQRKRLHHWEKD